MSTQANTTTIPNFGTDAKTFEDVKKELAYARNRFEGFDRSNTLSDWAAYITKYLGNAVTMGIPLSEARRQLVKVAGLVFSTIKAIDEQTLAPRHFETAQWNTTKNDPTGDF